MKKQSIVSIVILMLIFSVLISCSKDKPTENESNLSPSNLIVGSWELTTIKADGVVVDPENDTYNLWINAGIQTFNEDGTGRVVFDYGVTFDFTWEIDGEMLEITTSDDVISMRYTLNGDTLTSSQPAPSVNPFEYPDLEFIHTRM